jgi:GH15 family glucan-1,4-alpha-glucosidase
MMYEEPMLSDYALIGNSCSAALISKHGSIDWCCLPEFHSPSVFAALLDRKKGGYFSIAPVRENESSQRYLPDTNIVETSFRTDEGVVRITDAFIAMSEEAKKLTLFPDHEILRIVEGVSGTTTMKLDYSPRVFYGRDIPALKDRKKLGVQFVWKENIFILLSTLDPDEIKIEYAEGRATAEFDVEQGQQIIFSFSYSNQSPAVLPELRETAWTRMQQTIHYWQSWISKINYTGTYQKEVRRSVLALKLLAHAPSGSIIGAPTTSLPEMPGGERNWDYRFCWLRDASFTIRVLVKLGFEEEAHAYMNWILHATQLTRPRLQVVYSVYGYSVLKEKTIDWLSGYKNSKPVRIGNKADGQFQLDIYGEVLDAVYTYASIVKEFDHNSKKFIIGLGEVICKLWDKPDSGIWEIRSALVHHTHSKVMAWVGLDRLIKLCLKYGWNEAPVKKFMSTADAIRNDIEQYGFNSSLASYTRELNGKNIDASLLTLPLVDYCDPASHRMMSTTELIQERLSKNNLIYRYKDVDDGLAGAEGSFVVCNFWLVENLVKSGKIKEATTVFETVLQHASPTGLLSEEIDPESHELLGNYPQGFSHVGLINAALSINEANHKTI